MTGEGNDKIYTIVPEAYLEEGGDPFDPFEKILKLNQ